VAPPTSAAGEVCRYEVKSNGTRSIMEMRTLHDWVIIPRFLKVKGVGDVANFGGDAKQFVVSIEPEQLVRVGVSFNDVADAIRSNNGTAGGSVVTRGSMSFVIRGRGALKDEKEIGNIFVKSIDGTPIFISDLADVTAEPKLPSGIFGKDDNPHTIEGLITLRKGENPSAVLGGVEEAVSELNKSLPSGVQLAVFYNRAHLVSTTMETVGHSVGMGIALVIVVLLFFLGSPRLALLVSLTIPFSFLFAVTLNSNLPSPMQAAMA